MNWREIIFKPEMVKRQYADEEILQN